MMVCFLLRKNHVEVVEKMTLPPAVTAVLGVETRCNISGFKNERVCD